LLGLPPPCGNVLRVVWGAGSARPHRAARQLPSGEPPLRRISAQGMPSSPPASHRRPDHAPRPRPLRTRAAGLARAGSRHLRPGAAGPDEMLIVAADPITRLLFRDHRCSLGHQVPEAPGSAVRMALQQHRCIAAFLTEARVPLAMAAPCHARQRGLASCGNRMRHGHAGRQPGTAGGGSIC
jgi:hypothetical protein